MRQQSLMSWQQAENLLAAGDSPGASGLYEALTGDVELAAMARLRLSLIASRQGNLRRATDEALAAWRASRPDPELLDMVCKRLYSLGELEHAVAIATSDAMLASGNPVILAELGKLMSDAMLPEQSLLLLQRAYDIRPSSAALRYLLGLNLLYCGRAGEAEVHLEEAIAQDPNLAHAAWALAKLRRQTPDHNHVDRLRASVAAMGAGRGDAVLLHYALFKELDDLDRVDEAWAALDRAMQARRKQVRYDAAATRQMFDYLSTLTAQPPLPVADEQGATPIFIVGMPRSGTTLLERILGAHSQVADAGELHDFTWQMRWMANRAGSPYPDITLARSMEGVDFAELGSRYVSHTRWRAKGKPFFTDKMPANFLNIGYIGRALPHARILHMSRDPMDTCFSNLKEFFAGPYSHSYDQAEMADYYLRYERLMDHWREQFPGRILDVSYERLAAQPESVAREVLAFCGLPWQQGLVDIEARAGSVATASSVQVREPIHRRSIAQWRRYERYLQPMQEVLAARSL